MKQISIENFNEKQKYAIEQMRNGANVFLTGDAGTGKTTVIQAFIADAEKAGKSVLVTATTGIAAVNIGHGAMTVHRALGLSVHCDSYKNKVNSRRDLLKAADVLIIDEISMCRFDLFNMIGKIVEFENEERATDRLLCERGAREELQVIVTGDFYQLPPVISAEDRKFLSKAYGRDFAEDGKYKYGYAFLSPYWRRMNFEPINLDEVCRQSDAEFKAVLNDIKYGRNIRKVIAYLEENTSQDFLFDAPSLVGTNANADTINQNRLDGLAGDAKTLRAITEGEVTWEDLKLLSNSVKEEIVIKEGAKVMITVNAPDLSYVNGTIGTVEKIKCDGSANDYVRVLTEKGSVDLHRAEWKIEHQEVKTTWDVVDGQKVKNESISRKEVGVFKQFPIKLAWAISIHKSQGQTFSELNINPYCWDPGQFYVAVSRAKSANGIFFMRPIRQSYIKAFSKEDQEALNNSFTVQR